MPNGDDGEARPRSVSRATTATDQPRPVNGAQPQEGGHDDDRAPDEAAEAGGEPPRRRQSVHRTAFALALAVAVLVVVTLPFALRSVVAELVGGESTRYDLVAAATPTATVTASPAGTDRAYFNVAAVAVDETTGLATFAISGNRVCAAACPAVELTILALDDDASERRGLPPLAKVSIGADDRVFSQSVALPVRGRATLYPFDTYEIWLGFAVAVTGPDGTWIHPDLATIAQRVTIAFQSQVAELVMDPPVAVDASRVAAATDPFALPVVAALHFRRPDYLKILAVLLVLLISVSGGVAMMTRAVDELVLGVGGLILGVWGIRSVLVTQPLPGVSIVDLALSLVILFLLLGLMVRLIRYHHRSSNLHWPRK